jgi:hypothetical protein
MVTLATFITDLLVAVAILYSIDGLMRFAARCVLWLVRFSIRFGDGACNVQESGVPAANTSQPSLPEIKSSVSQARDALFAYQQRMLCARSEMREIAARTVETIAQTRSLIAQVDAIAAATRCVGRTRG